MTSECPIFQAHAPFREEFWRLSRIAIERGWLVHGGDNFYTGQPKVAVTFRVHRPCLRVPTWGELVDCLPDPVRPIDVISLATETGTKNEDWPVVLFAGSIGLSLERLVRALPVVADSEAVS